MLKLKSIYIRLKIKSLSHLTSLQKLLDKLKNLNPLLKDISAMSPIQKFDHFGIEFSGMEEDQKQQVRELIRQDIMEGHKKVSVDEIFRFELKTWITVQIIR